MTPDKIYELAGLSLSEKQKMPQFLDSHGDFYESTAFIKLFEYFCNTEEMPYGIAKARDGTPDDWILEHIDGLTS